MKRSFIIAASLLSLGSIASVLLLRRRSVRRGRQEFAERYAMQLRLSRETDSQPSSGKHASRDIRDADKRYISDGKVTVNIIYGSESGNAESLARGFAMVLRDHGVSASLIDPSSWSYLDAYLYHNQRNLPLFQPLSASDAVSLTSPSTAVNEGRGSLGRERNERRPLIYIFVVATAGEGEPAGNFMPLFQEMQLAVRRTAAIKSSATSSVAAAVAPPSSVAASAAPFANVYYAVFGLGDSSYKYYCRCATDTNALLKKGGAISLHRVGFGDVHSGAQEDVFDEWRENVMQALEEKCGLVMATGALAPPKPEFQFRFLTPDTTKPALTNSMAPDAEPSAEREITATLGPLATTDHASSNHNPIGYTSAATRGSAAAASAAKVNGTPAPVTFLPYAPPPPLVEPSLLHPIRIRLITKTQLAPPREYDGSSVYRFCFETDGTCISYQAGDHLAIFPTNPPEMVTRCATALSIPAQRLETPVELCEMVPERGEKRNVLPARVPLRVALERYADLCGRPKKATLRILAKYCTNPVEQEALMNLIRVPTHKGLRNEVKATEGDDLPRGPRMMHTVVDYLERFPSCCCIPLGHFMEIVPRMQPRYYSIASDPLSHGSKVEILVRALADGLASLYLAHRVQEGGEVFAYVRSSTFHLPQRIGENRAMLMIGPGTGAAALVGLCYRKEALMRKQPDGQYGSTVFFFGAQHRETEYFVAEEVHRWTLSPPEMLRWDLEHPTSHAGMAARHSDAPQAGALPSSVITTHDSAFSRDQEKKIYVTSLIDKHRDLIFSMLMSTAGGGCLVFLSGDASFMAKDVDRALTALLQQKGGMTRVAALEFLRHMEQDRRYLKDVY